MSSDGVREMLSRFERMARPLTFESKDGSITQAFRGVLRSPTPEEIVGGLHQAARVVIARASSFTSAGITPVVHDKILDPDDSDRRYVIDLEPTWLYHGSSRLWWRGAVFG